METDELGMLEALVHLLNGGGGGFALVVPSSEYVLVKG